MRSHSHRNHTEISTLEMRLRIVEWPTVRLLLFFFSYAERQQQIAHKIWIHTISTHFTWSPFHQQANDRNEGNKLKLLSRDYLIKRPNSKARISRCIKWENQKRFGIHTTLSSEPMTIHQRNQQFMYHTKLMELEKACRQREWINAILCSLHAYMTIFWARVIKQPKASSGSWEHFIRADDLTQSIVR